MSAYALLAALGGAGAVGNLTWRLQGPRRPPGRRMKPYFEVARSRLGGRVDSLPEPVLMGEAARRVLGPLARSVTSRFARVVRTKGPGDMALQLRQAGANFDLYAYRRSNLFWIGVLPVGLGLVGVFLGSAFLALLLLLLGVPLGFRRMPAHLRSLKRRRAERVRSDLPTVAVMLATKIANTKSLLVALREVTEIGTGPVVDDIKRALLLVESGYGARGSLRTSERRGGRTSGRSYLPSDRASHDRGDRPGTSAHGPRQRGARAAPGRSRANRGQAPARHDRPDRRVHGPSHRLVPNRTDHLGPERIVPSDDKHQSPTRQGRPTTKEKRYPP